MTVFASSLISTPRELHEFLSSIPPRATLYVDLEGDNICRNGSISVLTILIHQLQEIRIIDILSLGYSAFTTPSDSGETLKTILEDRSITKCFWDVRNYADALWALYNVNLTNVIDIQLLENASRKTGRDKEYLARRETAIRNDLNPVVGAKHTGLDRPLGSSWIPIQGSGKGSDELQDFPRILRRPLDKDIILDCTRDVLHLRSLRDVYMKRISIAWLGKVRQESAKRIAQAHGEEYVPQSPLEAKGPWKARIGTVGIAPLKPNGKFQVQEAENEVQALKTPKVNMIESKEDKMEKKRSRLLRWKDVASYRPEPRDSNVKIVEAASGDWWD